MPCRFKHTAGKTSCCPAVLQLEWQHALSSYSCQYMLTRSSVQFIRLGGKCLEYVIILMEDLVMKWDWRNLLIASQAIVALILVKCPGFII